MLADRGRYIAAILTIARAYRVAGSPGKLPPRLSFDEWSDNVRSALVWLGWPDPDESIKAVRAADPIGAKLHAVIAAWAAELIGRHRLLHQRAGHARRRILSGANDRVRPALWDACSPSPATRTASWIPAGSAGGSRPTSTASAPGTSCWSIARPTKPAHAGPWSRDDPAGAAQNGVKGVKWDYANPSPWRVMCFLFLFLHARARTSARRTCKTKNQNQRSPAHEGLGRPHLTPLTPSATRKTARLMQPTGEPQHRRLTAQPSQPIPMREETAREHNASAARKWPCYELRAC